MMAIFILALSYLGMGVVLAIYDAKQTDEKLQWDEIATWIYFLKWPTKLKKRK